MSDLERLAAAREAVEEQMADDDDGQLVDDLLRAYAHELADKIRHHIMANQSLANWQRHILYGLAGQSFEAQEALDKFEAALQAMYADLIDPQAGD